MCQQMLTPACHAARLGQCRTSIVLVLDRLSYSRTLVDTVHRKLKLPRHTVFERASGSYAVFSMVVSAELVNSGRESVLSCP